MAAISQTVFSVAFSWMKHFVFWLKFQWSLFLRVQLAVTQHWLDNGLAPNRRQAIIWSNADPIHWRIYAALGGRWVNEIAVISGYLNTISALRFCDIFLAILYDVIWLVKTYSKSLITVWSRTSTWRVVSPYQICQWYFSLSISN